VCVSGIGWVVFTVVVGVLQGQAGGGSAVEPNLHEKRENAQQTIELPKPPRAIPTPKQGNTLAEETSGT